MTPLETLCQLIGCFMKDDPLYDTRATCDARRLAKQLADMDMKVDVLELLKQTAWVEGGARSRATLLLQHGVNYDKGSPRAYWTPRNVMGSGWDYFWCPRDVDKEGMEVIFAPWFETSGWSRWIIDYIGPVGQVTVVGQHWRWGRRFPIDERFPVLRPFVAPKRAQFHAVVYECLYDHLDNDTAGVVVSFL